MAVVAVGLLTATASLAEPQWIRGEISLHLRGGPGREHASVGGLRTGDEVEVQERRNGWMKVRVADGRVGWIPDGYLAAEPPPKLRVDRLELEARRLRARATKAESQAKKRRDQSELLQARNKNLERDLARLSLEKRALSAGQGWPYLIAGALILGVGMLVGAAAGRTRRSGRRIKL